MSTNLENLSKESLVLLVKELQAIVATNKPTTKIKEYHGNRKSSLFDFSAFKQRKVALHISYIGHSFQGLALQGDATVNTIEVCNYGLNNP